MNYIDALAYLRSFVDYERVLPTGKLPTDYYLPRTAALLRDLGNPQRSFPCVVVAGTKGKGSTCAMLESVLGAAGLRVGLWTSPHLHSYRERVQVNRELIAPDTFATLVARMQPVVERFDAATYGGMPTTFELSFALALLYFAEQHVDFAVLEVGLGGRYDSANVVTPVLSVIASISYDHMEILGHTLTKIAYDKAGIIKPGVPVVTVPQHPEAATTIARVARAVGSALWIAGETLERVDNTERAAQQRGVTLALPPLGLRGTFQQQNARLTLGAVRLLREQGFAISDAAIEYGLSHVQWPGRLEVVGHAPLLVLDGAHNGDAAERLVEALRAEFSFKRLVLLLGVLKDKDIPAIVRALVPAADAVVLTRVANPRAFDDLGDLATVVAPHLRGTLTMTDFIKDALAQARSIAAPDDLICVTGSLSTVAAAREALGLAERD